MAAPPQMNARTECANKLVDQGNDDPTPPNLGDGIICIHRKLDPAKARHMKRIKRVSVSAFCYTSKINFSRLFIRR